MGAPAGRFVTQADLRWNGQQRFEQSGLLQTIPPGSLRQQCRTELQERVFQPGSLTVAA